MKDQRRSRVRALDARGLLCPLPILLATKELESAARLEVRVDDPAAPADFRSLEQAKRFRILKLESLVGSARPEWRIELERWPGQGGRRLKRKAPVVHRRGLSLP